MIVVRLSGGMGNQMFQYALGRALSLKNNTDVGFDLHSLLDRTPRKKNFTFRSYTLDLFAIDAEIVHQSKLPIQNRLFSKGILGLYIHKLLKRIAPSKGVERQYQFDKKVFDFGPNVYLEGYWQSYKYFETYEKYIRKDFQFLVSFPEHILQKQKEIMSHNAVCIHVRRGDYVGNSFHEVVTKEYYDQALLLLQSKTPVEHLYVFSDDIDWCTQHLSFSYPTFFVGDEYAGERASGHFLLMRSCTHFIIPNSSFAWWAAWLGEHSEKIVIAPKKWFANEHIDTSDLCPPEWIRI